MRHVAVIFPAWLAQPKITSSMRSDRAAGSGQQRAAARAEIVGADAASAPP
jgi:hypothetical protein